MNALQIGLVVAFLVSLLVAYRRQIAALVREYTAASISSKTTSIAVELVDDILAVTQLRDRLAAEGYQEGVDACTVLLRVIVEHNHTTKDVV
jgi:hypothetical protein